MSSFARALSLPTALLAVAVLLPSCEDDGRNAPTRLMDDSRVRQAPVDIGGVNEPTVLTSVRVVRVTAGDQATVATCLRKWDTRALGPAVVRVGVSGESVTYRQSRRELLGCDNGRGPREEGRRWCGGAFGRLYAGHLRDPRLDLGACATSEGVPLGFAWVEPGPGAAYVVVRQPGYAEVYGVAGELPVRVSTTSVVIEQSRATFELSEHDASGRRLRRYRLDARVAG